jgi:hypothetical protein
MNWLPYFLILLLVSAQVDDYWAPALGLPSAPLADDDDEYTSSEQRQQEKECSSSQKLVFVGLKPQTADLPPPRRGVSSEWDLTTPFTPPPLYIFMSLQI